MIQEIGSAVEQTAGHGLSNTLENLERLSWNYWWSWTPDGAGIFRDLGRELWDECEHNPRRMMREVPEFYLMRMATDPAYAARVGNLAARFEAYMAGASQAWAAHHAPQITERNPVAYFCAEFGVHHSLPLYSGGLGILAGDHLKSASDLGLPLVAVGLLYHHGYFRQGLRRDGWQEEIYNQVNVEDLPLQPVLGDDGAELTVLLNVRGREVRVRAWLVCVGRVSLYLLDTNVEGNDEIDRLITGHLYGGDRETRCVQEMVLGIGGIRLLRHLGVEPHVFHLNEGHSAFLTLELARELTEQGRSFEEAADAVRRRCVFTTHTPVAAGHDEFLPSLIEKCFDESYMGSLGLSLEEFMDLGRVIAGDAEELFGLTPLALRMCRSSNGVSKRHGEVSRELWNKMWPDRPTEEVPITHVTNGVHAPTWVSPLLASLFERHAGADWASVTQDEMAWSQVVRGITDKELWEVRSLMKRRLVAFVRDRFYHYRLRQGEPREYAEAARELFDPDVLTIGFARRVAAYKRWGLILTDLDRLRRIIFDEARPVQFIFAGKAHPQDQGAKVILQQIARWKLDPEVMRRAVFIQDYDQEIARHMVQAVDVWLNVPRRPLEASGTSGEKVAMNGGLNLSILDGWWMEGYDGENGWAIGGREVSDSVNDMDEQDAEALYRLLEDDVVPAFYERDDEGMPRGWIKLMRHALETLIPKYNSDRMVREYVEQIYLGA